MNKESPEYERVRKEALLTDGETEGAADKACNRAEKEGVCKAGDSCSDCRLREEAVAQAQLDKVLKTEGVVIKADDQSLPEIPKQHQRRRNVTDVYSAGWRDGYAWLIAKIQAGFVKVVKEEQ